MTFALSCYCIMTLQREIAGYNFILLLYSDTTKGDCRI